jgi:hypothetical protein
LHNRIVTTQQLSQKSKRENNYCSWCPGTRAIMDHMFFHCPSVTAFWTRLAKILHELLGPHPLQKKVTYIERLLHPRHSSPATRKLPAVVLAKTTIYNKYLARNSSHSHTQDCRRWFRVRLKHRHALQLAGKWYGYLQRLPVAWEHPTEDR